jgi:hypothetical protein
MTTSSTLPDPLPIDYRLALSSMARFDTAFLVDYLVPKARRDYRAAIAASDDRGTAQRRYAQSYLRAAIVTLADRGVTV